MYSTQHIGDKTLLLWSEAVDGLLTEWFDYQLLICKLMTVSIITEAIRMRSVAYKGTAPILIKLEHYLFDLPKKSTNGKYAGAKMFRLVKAQFLD